VVASAPLSLVHHRPVVTFDDDVRGVIDTGATALLLSQDLADALGLVVVETVEERGDVFTVLEPPGLSVDGYDLDVDGLPCFGFDDTRVLGLAASGLDMVVPASLVARHAVVLDMVEGRATFGPPGSLSGSGVRVRARMAEDGVRVAVPVTVLGTELSMLLDTGVSCSLVADNVARAWGTAPGIEVSAASVGPGNMAGLRVEARTPMVRVPAVTVGEEFTVPSVAFVWRGDADVAPYDGSLGGNVLRSFQLGLDLSRGDVYLEQRAPLEAIATDADQVGVTLVLVDDGAGASEWTIGAAVTGLPPAVEVGDVLVAVDGTPVSGVPIGDVLAALGGQVGSMRHLALRRGDSPDLLEATVPVQRLL
jgi:hypothetical protein